MNTFERARKYLASCPPAVSGQSGHNTTFSVATALTHGFALDREAALHLMREYNRSCQPPWSERELAHKVDQAIKTPHSKPRGFLLGDGPMVLTPHIPKQASVSPSGKFVVNRGEPVSIDPPRLSGLAATKQFLTTAFSPDEWVCVCLDGHHDAEHDKWIPASHGTFLPVSKWLDLLDSPSYFKKEAGVWVRINPTLPDVITGSDKNVSAYRHVLVEFDNRSKDEQLDIITRCQLPVTAVIDSGGKSLHAWVRVDAIDQREYDERRNGIYDYLSDVGIDPKNKNPSRFSRLPGAMRGKVEQSLVALNIGQPTWQQWCDWRDQAELEEPTKPSDLLNFDAEHDENNRLGNRWLCKGGSLVIVGQSGVGKSSFAMQFALTLALGRPFFGIQPVRPLRIAIVQAENDRGDMAEAFQGVVTGMGFSKPDMTMLDENVRFYDETVKTGSEFLKLARSIIAKHRADLLIADPLLSYAGDDISEQSFMSSFLRNNLNPILRETGACWVWLHHMPKPPKGDQAKGTISDLAYAGAGSADLTNWAREVAVLQREGDAPVFNFTLTKRGKRAGMLDSTGQPVTKIRLQHSSTGICWQYAPPGIFRPARPSSPRIV
jgi:RecA-family ATPase